MAIKLLASVPVAVDNFVEDLGLSRVLGTSRPGTFGLGGPALDSPPIDAPATAEVVASESVPTPDGRRATHGDETAV
ncbi:hypothetical protein C6A85_08400, partial [Mycobacterium sp. ITM-2017-0098]